MSDHGLENYSEEYTEELEKEEENLSSEDDSNENPPPDIIAFNELRSCADLVRMYDSKQLIIKPDFQRDIVWPKAAQTRFIDSLVKQLPIPSMCLSLDYKTEKRLMIDGLQRISSIIFFLTKDDWKLSTLEDIDPRISGRTSSYLKQKHHEIYSRIQNLTIPITVLRCDYSKKSHMNYLFTIFHRLNTGGNKLSNQEIRNCIFEGSFNDLLKRTVQSEVVRNLFSLEVGKSYRYAYEELILRILAFSDRYEKYNGKLAKFLNDYMEEKRDAPEVEIDGLERTLTRAVNIIYEKILDGKSLPRLSKATTEALFVGVARNLSVLEGQSNNALLDKYETLRKDALFSVDSLKEGLSAKDKVTSRLDRAVEIFRE